MLRLVMVVIGALFGSDLAGWVLTETKRAVCRIASGGEPYDPRPARSPSTRKGRQPASPAAASTTPNATTTSPASFCAARATTPSGDPEADKVYDNLGEVYGYYATSFGRDSYDDAGAELVASINFHAEPGTPTFNA